MKYLLSLVFFMCTQGLFASSLPLPTYQRENWGFGIGLGTESSYDSVTVIEIKTPTLFSILRGMNNLCLVASLESKNVAQSNKSTTPIHLLIEMSSNPYLNLIRTYFRLGGGSVLVDDPLLFKSSNFFNLQFQLGADFITGRTESGMASSFFTQVMINSPAIRHPPLDNFPAIYNGVSLVAGVRTYF